MSGKGDLLQSYTFLGLEGASRKIETVIEIRLSDYAPPRKELPAVLKFLEGRSGGPVLRGVSRSFSPRSLS